VSALLLLQPVARGLAVVTLVYAVIVWVTHWAVRARHLQPFGAWPRFIRGISDPPLKRIEKRLLLAGGNPQDAPLWLVGIVVIGGLVGLSLVDWFIQTIGQMLILSDLGPRAWIRQLADWLFTVVLLALFIRVIASWFGVSPYGRVMRIVYALTDWILDPLRKMLPQFGMIDLSPMVAYFLLTIARSALMGALL
jgi:YggT family protein